MDLTPVTRTMALRHCMTWTWWICAAFALCGGPARGAGHIDQALETTLVRAHAVQVVALVGLPKERNQPERAEGLGRALRQAPLASLSRSTPEAGFTTASWAQRRAAADANASPGWADYWQRVQGTAGFAVLSLVMFGIGRILPRDSSTVVVARFYFGLALLVSPALFVGFGGDTQGWGDGWSSRLDVIGGGFYALSQATAAAIMAGLMHLLRRLLQEEGRSWGETIATGWRRALQIGGEPTSRGEFWGFMLFCTWVWAFAAPLGAPWSRFIGVALLIPMLTLGLRRLRSLTIPEFWLLVGTLAVMAARAWL